jgi:hypothetical protein
VISERENCGEIPARVSPENKNIGESSHFAGEPEERKKEKRKKKKEIK